LNWAGFIVVVGSITIMTSTVLVSLIGQPRIFLQMAKDGLLFKIFGKVSLNGVPIAGTLITGIMSGAIGFCFTLDVLTNMISIGTLLAFIVVCGGVVLLRFAPPPPLEGEEAAPGPPAWKVPLILFAFFIASILFSVSFTHYHHLQPWSIIATAVLVVIVYIPLQFEKVRNPPKTFTCPLVPLVPCGGIFLNVTFIVSLPADSVYRVVIWTIIGFMIYFFYGIWNSRLFRKEEERREITQSILNPVSDAEETD